MSNEVSLAEAQGPLTEAMQQFSGRENGRRRFEEFKLWLKRVKNGVLLIIDRTLTPEQAVNATLRVWLYKNQAELDKAPVSGSSCVEQEIFELDYEPTPTELQGEYVSRGLSPDLAALAKYMCEKPEAAGERPVACQWGLHPDGTAAYAVFWRGSGVGGIVDVNRHNSRWPRKYRFAGVREVSA